VRFDGFLDSFFMRVRMSSWTCSRDSFVGPRLYSCDAFIGSSHIVPLRSRWFSNDCLAPFFELISHGMLFRETQWLLCMNQILHLTNSHDKLSIFVLYPSLGFSSIYLLTLWDPRLRHLSLSLLSYVGRRIRDGEHGL
jgi:hypothetical protein